MNGDLLKVPAKDLRPGDYTLGSRQTVIRVLHHAVHIPVGKVEVELERESGKRRVALWNRSTKIGIRRGAQRLTASGSGRPLPSPEDLEAGAREEVGRIAQARDPEAVMDALGADRLEALGIESQLDPAAGQREARAIFERPDGSTL